MRCFHGMGLAVLAAVLFCGGCGNSADRSPNNYPRDGRLGATQANPNYPTSPTYHTYSMDKAVIRGVLDQFPEVRSSNIHFMGPNAHVRVQLDPGMDKEKATELQRELQTAVSSNLPRYRVQLKVDHPALR
jgi:hypothetical protein